VKKRGAEWFSTVEHWLLVSGTCLPVKPASAIFSRLESDQSYFPGFRSTLPLQNASTDWRYYLQPKHFDKIQSKSFSRDSVITKNRGKLRGHSQWCILSRAAMEMYLDEQCDILIRECAEAQKFMEAVYQDRKGVGQFSPAPDEWVPLSILLLHQPPLSKDDIESGGLTEQFLLDYAPHPVEWSSVWSEMTVPVTNKAHQQMSLVDALLNKAKAPECVFFRKVLASIQINQTRYLSFLENPKKSFLTKALPAKKPVTQLRNMIDVSVCGACVCMCVCVCVCVCSATDVEAVKSVLP
jgi:hypothetical protein